jgi:guanylate kinase
MIKTGDTVKVERIIDTQEANHLVSMINRKGVVISWIVYKQIKRFKVQFQDGTEYFTSYFREDELIKIEDGKIYAIIGYSATGKDSLLNLLVDNGFIRVVSDTSRPMRSSELNGREYNFRSFNEMLNMEANNEFVEIRKYSVVNNQTWLYGIHKDSIDLKQGKNYICVVDCQGFESLQAYYGKDNVIGIYLYVNARERLLRALNRCELIDTDVDEIVRRYEKDKVDFKKEVIDKCVLKINNVDINETLNMVLNNIKRV